MFGCGQRKEESSQPTPARTPEHAPVADQRPVIAAFGDSLSAGLGADPGKSYPDFLQQLIDRRGYGYHVVNAGVSGDTTADGLERLTDIISLRPAIVILEFGGNDGLRGLPVVSTRANLEKMIIGLQQAGIRVVLAGMTLPRNYGVDYIRAFERMYADLAKKYDLTLIPFLLEGVGGIARYMQPDGIHPNAEGNERVAAVVFRYLEPLLPRR